MTRDNAIRIVLSLVPMLVATVFGQPALAEDAVKSRPVVTDEGTETILKTPQDLAQVIWDVLDAIQRDHVQRFPRNDLIRPVARVLTKLDSGDEYELVAANLLLCQDAKEMNVEVARLWGAGPLRAIKLDDTATEIVEMLEKVVGQLRLIRAKDFVVEQQIGGNRYVGVGVAISIHEQHQVPIFHQIFPGGPADRGGLRPSDLVTSIDGKSTKSEPLLSVIDRLRGPAGTEVVLEILDPKSDERRNVTLIRGVVRTDSLRDQSFEPLSHGKIQSNQDAAIGWIRLSTLTGSTVHELRVADERSRQANLNAMVLDFRNSHASTNLHEAKLVADALLDGGPIWTRVERDGQKITEIADRDCLFRDLPLVVLVDNSTGLTHRVLAAALQDAGRATIVGPRFQQRLADGLIPLAEKLPNVPYALSMFRTRINRARTDRDWPLVPDQLVAEPQATQQNVAKYLSLGGQSTIEKRSPMVVKIERPASALDPANQPAQHIIAYGSQAKIPNRVDPAVVSSRGADTFEATALHVARDLIKNRPAG